MLYKLQGDSIKATDLYHEVSLKYEKTFGRQHPVYLNALATYGAALVEVKELETAANVFEKLIKGRKRTNDVFGYLHATLQLAATCRELNEYQKAY